MKVDDTAYMTFREIQLMEEKSPLLTKIVFFNFVIFTQ